MTLHSEGWAGCWVSDCAGIEVPKYRWEDNIKCILKKLDRGV
jgi:hypothetical protein